MKKIAEKQRQSGLPLFVSPAHSYYTNIFDQSSLGKQVKKADLRMKTFRVDGIGQCLPKSIFVGFVYYLCLQYPEKRHILPQWNSFLDVIDDYEAFLADYKQKNEIELLRMHNCVKNEMASLFIDEMSLEQIQQMCSKLKNPVNGDALSASEEKVIDFMPAAFAAKYGVNFLFVYIIEDLFFELPQCCASSNCFKHPDARSMMTVPQGYNGSHHDPFCHDGANVCTSCILAVFLFLLCARANCDVLCCLQCVGKLIQEPEIKTKLQEHVQKNGLNGITYYCGKCTESGMNHISFQGTKCYF